MVIIYYNLRHDLSQQECIDEHKSWFDDKAPFYSTVKNWFNEFSYARRSLKDELREGRSKTAIVSENIVAVRELIMQDRHVTYLEIEASLNIFFQQLTFNICIHSGFKLIDVCSQISSRT